MSERRRHFRFDTALNAICEAAAQKWKAATQVKNISKEGALLVVPKPLTQGAELTLSMDVPGDNIPIFASCQVAWQKGKGKGEIYETGVKFTRMENSDKGRLLDHIYNQWLRFLDRK